MRALSLIRLSPWPVAAVVAVVASVLSAMAAVEVRRGVAANRGIVAMMLCSLLTMLCLLELTPAMITAAGGVGMTIVVAGGCHDDGPLLQRVAGVMMIFAVILIAVDIGTQADPPSPTAAPEAAQGFFWSTVAISAMATLLAAGHPESRPCRLFLMVGTGIQAVASLALAYVILSGQPGYIPLIIASAMLEMWMVKTSLRVNPLHAHLPVAFATWQMGVWISAPCVTAVQYHGTVLTAVGTVVTVVAAGILAWGSGCPCTVDLD